MRPRTLLASSLLTLSAALIAVAPSPVILRRDLQAAGRPTLGDSAEPAFAPSLVWATQRVDLSPGFEAYRNRTLEARFPVTNAGKSSWEIVALEPDCGCTATELAKRTLAPGESTEVVARFAVADRMGRHEKHIVVRARDQESSEGSALQVGRLTLVINLPELVRITPAKLSWALGEGNTPKTMLIEAASAEMPIERLSVKSTQALFQPEVRVLEVGRRYELTVTPVNTEVLLTGHLPISCEFARPQGTAAVGENPPRVFVVIADIAPSKVQATAAAAQAGQ